MFEEDRKEEGKEKYALIKCVVTLRGEVGTMSIYKGCVRRDMAGGVFYS